MPLSVRARHSPRRRILGLVERASQQCFLRARLHAESDDISQDGAAMPVSGAA